MSDRFYYKIELFIRNFTTLAKKSQSALSLIFSMWEGGSL